MVFGRWNLLSNENCKIKKLISNNYELFCNVSDMLNETFSKLNLYENNSKIIIEYK